MLKKKVLCSVSWEFERLWAGSVWVWRCNKVFQDKMAAKGERERASVKRSAPNCAIVRDDALWSVDFLFITLSVAVKYVTRLILFAHQSITIFVFSFLLLAIRSWPFFSSAKREENCNFLERHWTHWSVSKDKRFAYCWSAACDRCLSFLSLNLKLECWTNRAVGGGSRSQRSCFPSLPVSLVFSLPSVATTQTELRCSERERRDGRLELKRENLCSQRRLPDATLLTQAWSPQWPRSTVRMSTCKSFFSFHLTSRFSSLSHDSISFWFLIIPSFSVFFCVTVLPSENVHFSFF